MCVCCGVFVPDYDEVLSVWLVCMSVVMCLFLIMIRCGVSGLCVCCGLFVPGYDEVWSVWLVCVCVLWCVCS